VRVAVVDHGMGNLRSVSRALEAAGAQVEVTSEHSTIDASDALCVPGQGIFGRCMAALTERCLDKAVVEWLSARRPFLGICLGMQVLFEDSAEGDGCRGLGVLAGRVVRLPDSVRVPHIGWNTVNGEYFYFDHSYAVLPGEESVVRGWCSNGIDFAAWVETGSATAVQFHPEKSGSTGIEFLRAWLGTKE
jgi:imidazole glycerol-phosphate synthase subunit HisH